jgi:hypothetical protein
MTFREDERDEGGGGSGGDKNWLHRRRPEALGYQKESYGSCCTELLRVPSQRLYTEKQSCVTEIDYTTNLATERGKRCLKKTFRRSNFHVHGKGLSPVSTITGFVKKMPQSREEKRAGKSKYKTSARRLRVSTALDYKERFHLLYFYCLLIAVVCVRCGMGKQHEKGTLHGVI